MALWLQKKGLRKFSLCPACEGEYNVSDLSYLQINHSPKRNTLLFWIGEFHCQIRPLYYVGHFQEHYCMEEGNLNQGVGVGGGGAGVLCIFLCGGVPLGLCYPCPIY